MSAVSNETILRHVQEVLARTDQILTSVRIVAQRQRPSEGVHASAAAVPGIIVCPVCGKHDLTNRTCWRHWICHTDADYVRCGCPTGFHRCSKNQPPPNCCKFVRDGGPAMCTVCTKLSHQPTNSANIGITNPSLTTLPGLEEPVRKQRIVESLPLPIDVDDSTGERASTPIQVDHVIPFLNDTEDDDGT